MRELKMEEIREFANRPRVKKVAVENFLTNMGTDVNNAVGNVVLDARQHGWNKETVETIMDGIALAAGLGKETD